MKYPVGKLAAVLAALCLVIVGVPLIGCISLIVSNAATSQSNAGSTKQESAGAQEISGVESQSPVNGTSVVTITSNTTVNGNAYSSAAADENALRISGTNAVLNNIIVNKLSGDATGLSGSSLCGDNAGLLALNGSTVTISGGTVSTGAAGAAGVFSIGTGTAVNISGSSILTAKDNAAGLAAEEEGTINGDGGSITTDGYDAPAVTSASAVNLNGTVLTANHSEAVLVKNGGSASLTDCTVTGFRAENEESDNAGGIVISSSADENADGKTASFSAEGGSVTAGQGDLFRVEGVSCSIELAGVSLQHADGNLLTVTGSTEEDSSEQQGAKVQFAASEQELKGTVSCDRVSSLDMELGSGSSFAGAVNGNGQSGTVKVTVENGAVWNLTGESWVTSVTNNGTVNLNGYRVHLADGSVIS
jgi:hypothetical protein